MCRLECALVFGFGHKSLSVEDLMRSVMIVCNTALLEDLLASLRKEQQKLEAEAERIGDGDLPPAGFTFAPMLL